MRSARAPFSHCLFLFLYYVIQVFESRNSGEILMDLQTGQLTVLNFTITAAQKEQPVWIRDRNERCTQRQQLRIVVTRLLYQLKARLTNKRRFGATDEHRK